MTVKKPHNLTGRFPRKAKSVSQTVYCHKCGLVILKNETTRKALEASCPDDIDV